MPRLSQAPELSDPSPMVRLDKHFAFILLPRAPYNFELTVKKPAGWDLFTPFEVYEGGSIWTALHIGRGMVGLKVRSEGETDSPRVSATAFLRDEPAELERETIKGVLGEKLGVSDDLAEFYSFAMR